MLILRRLLPSYSSIPSAAESPTCKAGFSPQKIIFTPVSIANLGTVENNAISVDLHTFPNSSKEVKDSFAEVCGAGVKVIKSKPIDNKLEIFLAPISLICNGGYAAQTNKGFNPSLSLTQCACRVLSLPPLTPTIQS